MRKQDFGQLAWAMYYIGANWRAMGLSLLFSLSLSLSLYQLRAWHEQARPTGAIPLSNPELGLGAAL
jgi:hypothetical protein